VPRYVKDARIESPEARSKIAAQSEPHWRAIVQGAHVGYYKGGRRRAWLVRWRKPEGGYQKATLGEADDTRDADGTHVLDYRQAQQKALEQVARWERPEVTGFARSVCTRGGSCMRPMFAATTFTLSSPRGLNLSK
jgi:hypothetical protein